MGLKDPIHKEPTTAQQMHMKRIADAVEALHAAMHDAEGSAQAGANEEHVFMTRRMKIAATHIETALMFARKATVEGS